MSCKSIAKTWKIMGVYCYTRKSHEPFGTDEKLIVAKQAHALISIFKVSTA